MRIESLSQTSRDLKSTVSKKAQPRKISERFAAAGRDAAKFLAELGFFIQMLLVCWLLRRRMRHTGRQMKIVILPPRSEGRGVPAPESDETATAGNRAGGDECST